MGRSSSWKIWRARDALERAEAKGRARTSSLRFASSYQKATSTALLNGWNWRRVSPSIAEPTSRSCERSSCGEDGARRHVQCERKPGRGALPRGAQHNFGAKTSPRLRCDAGCARLGYGRCPLSTSGCPSTPYETSMSQGLHPCAPTVAWVAVRARAFPALLLNASH